MPAVEQALRDNPDVVGLICVEPSYVGTLSNGGAVLAPFHDWASKVPSSLQSELNSVKQDIISGKIVPATKSPV